MSDLNGTGVDVHARSLFEENVRRCNDKAYNFAFRLTGNEQDARDLVQEAFSHALEHLARYDPKRPFEPWLNRILRNIYLDSVRRYDRKHTVSLDGPSPIEDMPWENIIPGKDRTPAEQADKKETEQLVQRALDSVPVQYRTAVVLCDIEKYSYERISQILECPIGTVRSRIHQGRLLMRKSFEKLQMTQRKARV
ncbi:MAG: sigma-70 family RNA polymerase sigma factor [Elusimicrobia bacterium]|nr:sigma-70 family RNA polymerase sigma factor [Elusimicrobiota bacterium]